MKHALIIILLPIIIVACRGKDSSPMVASVNGRDIGRAEFERFLALKMGEFNASDMIRLLKARLTSRYGAGIFAGIRD